MLHADGVDEVADHHIHHILLTAHLPHHGGAPGVQVVEGVLLQSLVSADGRHQCPHLAIPLHQIMFIILCLTLATLIIHQSPVSDVHWSR